MLTDPYTSGAARGVTGHMDPYDTVPEVAILESLFAHTFPYTSRKPVLLLLSPASASSHLLIGPRVATQYLLSTLHGDKGRYAVEC
jgi:hypothetical protein